MKAKCLHIGYLVISTLVFGCGTSEMTEFYSLPVQSGAQVSGSANWEDADLGEQSFEGSLILTEKGVYFGDSINKISVSALEQNPHGLLEKKLPPKTYDGKLYICGTAKKPYSCGCGTDGTGGPCTFTTY